MDLKAVLNTAGREQCNETLFTLLDRFLNPAFVALVEDTLKDELEIAESVLKEAGAPDTSIKDVIKAACSKLAHRIAGDTGEAAMQQVSDFFGALVSGKADELRTAAVDVFTDSRNNMNW